MQSNEAKKIIISASGNDRIHTFALDLSSQADVKRFAKEIKSKYSKLHYLINNSGLGSTRYDLRPEMTKDGYESVMATNYLGNRNPNTQLTSNSAHQTIDFRSGPFVLTNLLKDLVVSSGEPGDPSRIIHVSSSMNALSKLSLSGFASELRGDRDGFWGRLFQYSATKFLQICFSDDLARQFKTEGAPTESVALNPGKLYPCSNTKA